MRHSAHQIDLLAALPVAVFIWEEGVIRERYRHLNKDDISVIVSVFVLWHLKLIDLQNFKISQTPKIEDKFTHKNH